MKTSTKASDALIAGLQSPAAFDHPSDDLCVLETHISWVVLVGPFAYKIKKPVDLGFLDFTTLERRRHFCEEELRLNRRLAPALYLDVVPIAGTHELPRVNGAGQPIEYAVRMHRFPQEALLSHVLKQQALTPKHIDELAATITDFHSHIPSAASESSYGAPDEVWRPMQENLEHLAEVETTSPGNTAFKTLEGWCHDEFRAHRDDFQARKAGHFVRECHGDMHLGNMLLLDGKVVIFDCIEFNDHFRWIDVLNEVAFTVMDLEDRGKPDFAHRLLNAYLERTGDYAGLQVFPYYFVYRALIRAKVALIRLQQTDVAADEAKRLLAECQGYLELAERTTQRPSARLFITYGPSGSGKSTLTQPLLEGTGAIRLRSDYQRKRLSGFKPLERDQMGFAAGIYGTEVTQQTYQRLAELARVVLQAGFSTIVDATFLKRWQREIFVHLARELSVPLTILEFQASESILRERVQQRATAGDDLSDADLTVLAQQLASQEPLEADERTFTRTIDAELATDDNVLAW
jgi:uncharacterized protein